MKKLIWVLMIGIFWLGCKPGVPANVIQPDKMEKILFDIHVVDGYLSTIYIQDSAKKVASGYYNGIYKKFSTDSTEYHTSLIWYNNHPAELEQMYKRIQSGLSKQKKAMEIADRMIRKKQFRSDSTKIAKKFKADSLEIRKKMKPDSLSKVKALGQIARKKKQADSLINLKKAAEPLLVPAQAVQ
ncbi:DUF4296 domain-containing protein [Pedobacter sp. BMA]|uniref:DUF4296 domain-containing protein n=1 Tax=Pedobacter sp. BMA TaxID=1663685 RepID=UPI0006495DBE|nr:DUF4296 domain-containing protein [Pedobacter sp. BMA]KLT63661.1 hypothetical protein AB669_20595 [Pedobacter sp. BMA]